MKLILQLITFAALAGASALPARADVAVTENARVIKDGDDIGAVPDAIKNGVVTPSEVQSALLKLLVGMKAEREAAQTEAIAAKAKRDELLGKLDVLTTGTTAEKKTAIDALKQADKDRRRSEAQAEFDAARKKLEEASK